MKVWEFKRIPPRTREPLAYGQVHLAPEGLQVTAEDAYYSGVIDVEDSVEMAVEVLAKFAPQLLKT